MLNKEKCYKGGLVLWNILSIILYGQSKPNRIFNNCFKNLFKLISNSFFSFNIIAGSIISLINSFSTEFIVLDILLYTELLIKSDE